MSNIGYCCRLLYVARFCWRYSAYLSYSNRCLWEIQWRWLMGRKRSYSRQRRFFLGRYCSSIGHTRRKFGDIRNWTVFSIRRLTFSFYSKSSFSNAWFNATELSCAALSCVTPRWQSRWGRGGHRHWSISKNSINSSLVTTRWLFSTVYVYIFLYIYIYICSLWFYLVYN